MTTANKHLAGAEWHAESVVMRIGRLHEVPLSVAIEFGGSRWYKAGSMTSHYRRFAINQEHRVSGSGNIQVRQAYSLNLHNRTCALCFVIG